MKRLYIVTVSCKIVVYAESPTEAEGIAAEASESLEYHAAAADLDELPEGVDREDLPFTDAELDEDRTIGALIEAGTAPMFGRKERDHV